MKALLDKESKSPGSKKVLDQETAREEADVEAWVDKLASGVRQIASQVHRIENRLVSNAAK